MSINFNLSTQVKAGLIPAIPYLSFVLILLALIPTHVEGGWALVPLGLITYFPFVFLFELFQAWIAGYQDIPLSTLNEGVMKMIIGGVINTVTLFLCGYMPTIIFKKVFR